MSIKAIPINPESLQRVMRELIDAGTAVSEAAFVCSPELWRRLADALADARAIFPGADGMPDHNELLARGAESLGDGVYAEETPEGIKLTGNAYSRENVIYLETRTYRELRKFAVLHGYEPGIAGRLPQKFGFPPLPPASEAPSHNAHADERANAASPDDPTAQAENMQGASHVR